MTEEKNEDLREATKGEDEAVDPATASRTFRILGIVVAVVLIIAAVAVWFVTQHVFTDNGGNNEKETKISESTAENTAGWSAEDYLTHAEQAYGAGNYGDAVNYYEKALESGTGHLEAYLSLAGAYERLNRAEDTESCYAELIEKAEAAESLTEAESAALKTAYYHKADAYVAAGDTLMAYTYLSGKTTVGDLLADYASADDITPIAVELLEDGMTEDGQIRFGTYPMTEVVSEVFTDLTFDERNRTELYGTTYYREEINGTYRYFIVQNILWNVVKEENGNYLLLADKILDTEPYNEELTTVDWEFSTLRAYLAEEFTAQAFTEEEAGLLLSYTNGASMNPSYAENKMGNTVSDKVFILDVLQLYAGAYRDFHTYMKEHTADYKAITSEYAVAKGNFADLDGYGRWWVRTIGVDTWRIIVVGASGGFSTDGYDVNAAAVGVRPAIVLSKSNF